jgi:rubrerythrin
MIHLKPELVAALSTGGVPAICTALQQAIELEHSTIPPYLYALYSLDKNLNGEIADIIESVAVEEMLHLTLAANVLNALGGNPVLNTPGFIPTYPGPLPGGVESQLTVQLAPFSMSQLETFLTIEEPEHAIDIPTAKFAAEAIAAPVTIGQFYNQIIAEINKLSDSDFANPPRNQIGPDLMFESIVVTNKATAVQALSTIIEQGEGTSNSPEEIVGGDYAHFYRFQQIQKGKKLIAAPGQKPPWIYGGAPITIDPAGVYKVPTNPNRKNSSPAQLNLCDTFNYTYTNLLKTLHNMFNGHPDQFNPALGLMMSLKSQAKAMMSGIPDPSVITGPTFEYQPTNP